MLQIADKTWLLHFIEFLCAFLTQSGACLKTNSVALTKVLYLSIERGKRSQNQYKDYPSYL